MELPQQDWMSKLKSIYNNEILKITFKEKQQSKHKEKRQK